jgi:SAM-dependent methyltransferase
MVVNRDELTSALTKFYDFRGKKVLYVGCGLGQLLPPGSGVASVVGIDRDAKALGAFRRVAATTWAGIPITFVPRKFETIRHHGDVAYFEFCMHMMKDPRRTLKLARSLAKDVVIMDHLPGSKWVYYWAGEEQVARSTKAIQSFGIKREKTLVTEQRFEDGKALAKRLDQVGREARRRIMELKDAKDIRMRMDYGLYLLTSQ